jgi:hypothetical protein
MLKNRPKHSLSTKHSKTKRYFSLLYSLLSSQLSSLQPSDNISNAKEKGT